MDSKRHHTRFAWIAAWILGFAASMIAYAQGWPILTATALAIAVPAVHVALTLCESRILAYGVAVATLAAVWETGGFEHRDFFYGSGVNYADVLEELYPDRAETLFERADQVTACKMDPDKWQGAACGQLRSISDTALLELYERAFASQVKGDENQLYTYAVVLVLLKADPEKVAAAVAIWKKSFPGSDEPDPRSWAPPVRK